MAPPSPSSAEGCRAQREEIQAILADADERWRGLEARAHEAEETALRAHFDGLRGPLGLQDSDLVDWTDGGLRRKVRGRVERLLLAPVAERMREEVGLRAAAETPAETAERVACHVLDEFAERWESDVEPLLRSAGLEDAKLERRAHRLAKIPGGGPAAAPVGRDPERSGVWTTALAALGALQGPAQRLAGFWQDEARTGGLLEEAVPAVVARAVCDWRFQSCAAELDQLDNWWQCARTALQKREHVWETLLQEEGLFIRRVERGVAALHATRARYIALADFGARPPAEPEPGGGRRGGGAGPGREGGDGWPEVEVKLLADAIQEIRSRLRPIRDSAAWRVVDAARSLQRRLRGAAQREPTAWENLTCQEGSEKLAEALASAAVEATPTPEDLADIALVFMQRLDLFTKTVGDLRDFAQEIEGVSSGRGLADVLDRILVVATDAAEELLATLDDPTAEALDAWRGQWQCWGATVDAGALQSAVAALQLKPDSALGVEERRARRSRLLLLRGLQAFLGDASFRVRLLAPDFSAGGVVDRAAAAPETMLPVSAFQAPPMLPVDAAPAVDEPPTPCRDAAAGAGGDLSPRGGADGYTPPRRSRARLPAAEEARRVAEESPPEASGDDTDVGSAGAAAAAGAEKEEATPPAPTVPAVAPGFPSAGVAAAAPGPVAGAEAGLGAGALAPPLEAAQTRPGTAESWARPQTPSWLLPPWPRPDTPSAASAAASWPRPDTPSTVCDDAELSSMPRFKYVDGQRVSMRLGTGARLPPLRAQLS